MQLILEISATHPPMGPFQEKSAELQTADEVLLLR